MFRVRPRPPSSPPTTRRSSTNAPQRAGIATEGGDERVGVGESVMGSNSGLANAHRKRRDQGTPRTAVDDALGASVVRNDAPLSDVRAGAKRTPSSALSCLLCRRFHGTKEAKTNFIVPSPPAGIEACSSTVQSNLTVAWAGSTRLIAPGSAWRCRNRRGGNFRLGAEPRPVGKMPLARS